MSHAVDTHPPALLSPRARSLRLICFIIWSVALCVIIIRLSLQPEKHSLYHSYFYPAGLNWRQGLNLYEKTGHYRYSPLVAALLAALSYLPLRISQFPWLILNVVTLFSGLALWLRSNPLRRLTPDGHWAIVLLSTPLLIGNINDLHANPMVLGFLLMALAWAFQQRWTLVALAIAAATLLKIYPLAFGLLLLLHYPRQLSWRLLLALALGLLLPFLFQYPNYVFDSYGQWFHNLLLDRASREHIPLERQYNDATILWIRWIGPLSASTAQTWSLGTAAFAGIVAFWGQWWHFTRDTVLHFLAALTIIWILLAGPSTEPLTYMHAAPLTAWLFIEAIASNRTSLRILALASYLLQMIAVLSSWFPFGTIFKTLGWQPASVFLLLAALIVWLRNQPSPSANQSTLDNACLAGHTPRPNH